MREVRLPLGVVFAGTALIGIVVCAALAASGMDLGLNLAFVGLLVGLVLPLGIEIRSRTARPRRVVILDYRLHQYGQAVARGVREVLASDRRHWQSEYRTTGTASTDGSVQWQIHQIQSAVIDEFDGLVLVPSSDDDNLWYAVASAVKAGTFVVVVDTKPPNKIFRDVGIEAPRFVSSRYSQTGVLTGELLLAWMAENPERRCVIWNGPEGSWPGEERSRNVIYRLASAGLLDRMLLMPIDSWTPDAERCNDTLRFVSESPGEVAIYCADDENAMALHLYTLTESPRLRSQMYIIGCNGTPDDYGNVVAVDMRAVDATIDILAEEQGSQAGMLFIRERNGQLTSSERSVYIEPRILIRSSSRARWMDSIFDHEVSRPFEPATVLVEPNEPEKLFPHTLIAGKDDGSSDGLAAHA